MQSIAVSPQTEPPPAPTELDPSTSGGRTWSRSRQPFNPTVALVVLVAVSAVVRFAVALSLPAPWIAPDEMLYGLLGRSLWETGEMQLLGESGPFYGFYPVLAGLPLALLGPLHGLTALQAMQSLLVSSIAVIVYAWALRLVSAGWALTAAAMAVAMPALAYSGLIMTEALFLPAATLALWLLARALATTSWQDQVLAGSAITFAIATRIQGIGLVVAAGAAVVLMTILERDRALLRRFVPLAAATGFGLVLLFLARQLIGAQGGALGAYATTVNRGFRLPDVLQWSLWEAADVFLLVAGVPLLATVALAVGRLRRPPRDPHLSALLAIALAYCATTVVQVGTFASQHSQHLAERYLITVAPPLFVGLVVWLSRGAFRGGVVATIVVVVCAAPAILLPTRLIGSDAVPDAFMTIPLLDLSDVTSTRVLAVAWPIAAAALTATVLVRRRGTEPAIAALVLLALVGASVLAQRTIDDRVKADRRDFFGTSDRAWIDGATSGDVTYLDDGDPLWNGIWHQLYWNRRLAAVATLADGDRIGLPGVVEVSARPDGHLHAAGADSAGLTGELFVAPRRLTLVGERVRAIEQGKNQTGLQLWRTPGPPRLATRTVGFLPDGDIVGSSSVTVYACDRGLLHVALYAAAEVQVATMTAAALRPVSTPIRPGYLWHAWVATPPRTDGEHTCRFRISTPGRLGSTTVSYEQDGSSSVPEGAIQIGGGPGQTDVLLARGARLPSTIDPSTSRSLPRHGYCLDGTYLDLDAGQPHRDPGVKRAVLAIFVEGIGLTCDPPPAGYVRRGFATEAMHVPGGIYPFFAPP